MLTLIPIDSNYNLLLWTVQDSNFVIKLDTLYIGEEFVMSNGN